MIFHSNDWKHLDNIIVQKILLKRVQPCNLRTAVKTKNPIFFKWAQGRIYYIQNTMIRGGGKGGVEYLLMDNQKQIRLDYLYCLCLQYILAVTIFIIFKDRLS